HADEALAPSERSVMKELEQYVDANNPLLHRFAAFVEQVAFVDAAAKSAAQSALLALVHSLSSKRPNRLQRVRSGDMHNIVNEFTTKLADTSFVMVRGINDARGQVVREQNLGDFNNVCRLSVDCDVLRGFGRA